MELALHFSLIMVGAHDGSKTELFTRTQAGLGAVLLIEPVPFLFNRLSARYAALPNVAVRSFPISTEDREVEFVAPKESASSVCPFGDQLGSLISNHAVACHAEIAKHVEIIRMRALSFNSLIVTENVSSIDVLFTDAEGMDVELLLTFPFSRITPGWIIFEFKHSDGCGRVGRRLAALLNLLEDHDYRVTVSDSENMSAKHRSFKG